MTVKVRDRVEVALQKTGATVANASAIVDGNGRVELDMPDLDEGGYTVVVNGTGFEERAGVRIENPHIVFLETDKPIYKPG